jgi:spermidine synthase
LFGVSGAVGLGYELLWLRLLGGLFGQSLHATSLVLAVFMAGLAVGGWWLAPWLLRRCAALPAYAALEGGLGLWALLLPAVVDGVRTPYVTLVGLLDGAEAPVVALRLALTATLLGPPAICLGATLPLFARGVEERFGGRSVGDWAALSYGVNTLGAVAGVLVSGLLLLPTLGVRGTSWVLALANGGVACAALGIGRAARARGPFAADSEAVSAQTGSSPSGAALAVAALTGAALLALEVAWMRVLTVLTSETVFAQTTTLAGFLLGLALGGLVAARRPFGRRGGLDLSVVVRLELALAAFAFLSPVLLGSLADVLPRGGGTGGGRGATFAVVVGFFLVPTALSGACAALLLRGAGRRGERVGRLYAANSAGSVLGALFAGVVGVPWLGARTTILLAGICCVLAAVAARDLGRETAPSVGARRPRLLVGFGLVTLLLVVASGRDRYELYGRVEAGRGRVVFAAEDAGSLVEVVDRGGVRTLITDRRNHWGSTHPAMVLAMQEQGLLPLLLHPGPRRVVDVGVATGGSFAPLLAEARLEQAEVVELSPAVARAARSFADVNGHFWEDSRTSLLVADGRNHLLVSQAHYDLVVLGLFTPYAAGAGDLYSRELYQRCRERLAPGGLVVQWLPLDQLSELGLRSILATFADVFGEVHAFERFQYLMLLGGDGRVRIERAMLEERLASLEPMVRSTGLASTERVLSRYLLGPGAVRALGEGAPRNTEDRPVVEFSPVDLRRRGTYRQAVEHLELMHRSRSDPLRELGWDVSPEERRSFERVRQARLSLVRGVMAEAEGDAGAARQHLRHAAALAPEDPLARALAQRLEAR